MDKLIVTGGRKLKGTVRVSGAKNAALPCMAATILANGTHRLHNLPQVADVRTMSKLLVYIGAEIYPPLAKGGEGGFYKDMLQYEKKLINQQFIPVLLAQG